MIIGISGKARAGKDTSADLIINRIAYGNWKKYSFAYPIKEACRVIFGWGERQLYGDLKESVDPLFGVTPRYAMQTLGTEWGRDIINSDIWIKRAKVEHDNMVRAGCSGIVIPDVRFENELEFIRENGGIHIRVERAELEVIDNSGHVSEKGLPVGPDDLTVHNYGSIACLELSLREQLNMVGFKYKEK